MFVKYGATTPASSFLFFPLWVCCVFVNLSVVFKKRQKVVVAIAGKVRGVQVGQQLVWVGQLREKLQRKARTVTLSDWTRVIRSYLVFDW